MHILLHKVEKLVDASIGPLLAVLFIVIIGELFFSSRFEPYHKYADYFDILLISVFAVDLAFKFNRVRKIPLFLRKYWIEIIATIPFFLVFRFTEFFGLNELVERSQTIAHEVPEVEKLEREAGSIVKDAGRGSRAARAMRVFRALSRFPRFLRVLHFFEMPTGRHHWHEHAGRRKRRK